MYRYDAYDHAILRQRVAQYRDQVRRWKTGELSDDEFRPLRLQNGLYIQRHAPMFRIAVPYGLLSSTQLRKLAEVARDYDRGYGHFTTRHNLQLNWPKVEDTPDILEKLADVEMHAIQTSGNCVRNVTTSHFAGIDPDEIADPRPFAELLREWSTFQPEFAFLPRKFKIAVSGSTRDRAVTLAHDIGLNIKKNAAGEIGFEVLVGGGLGRTPILAKVIEEFLPWQHLLTFVEAILRVYNSYGRRDNPYKARIKILVHALGAEQFRKEVLEEWANLKDGPSTVGTEELERIARHFTAPDYAALPARDERVDALKASNPAFARWVARNVHPHKQPGYAAVTISLKDPRQPPGDCTSEQMEAVADLADQFSFGELRVSHEQNLVLPDVPVSALPDVWEAAKAKGLSTPTVGLLTDLICCPGGDYCSLANAKSIPIAAAIQERFADLDYLFDIGDLDLNISGCMNACGHHHVGHIGILGVDKNGEEWYQVTLGGHTDGVKGRETALGKVIGPSFSAAEVPEVVETLVRTYVAQRHDDERFLDTFERLGLAPFKEAVYAGRRPAALNTSAARESTHA
ncbi:sulfite reductase (NADPH) hemoprotein beta-component [Oryzomicrobium terrae]|uniref:Sulfite reductase (NADPH) hemoprotein beta-component n=1 Tax=Oryzomicrobium terrae TaxID=1735038 RepID=A0A5C1E8Y6_9RHOO|nr:nitrite/sulfite reductase [Oryzomicrobium terrae]QEL65330.1 sulfite reductase (NADPH) hemoprotein beta-component [Oryzomicrobium terrae]